MDAMDEVIVADEKHGTVLYATAVGLLSSRLEEGYWYSDADRLMAETALEGGEATAWAFLEMRSDHEYEGVEWQVVH
jgi:hypothetical protein